MKRTEIPAAKVWCDTDLSTDSVLDVEFFGGTKEAVISGHPIPCILRTAAADKLILDVVRAAIVWNGSTGIVGCGTAGIALDRAIAALKNAGVKL